MKYEVGAVGFFGRFQWHIQHIQLIGKSKIIRRLITQQNKMFLQPPRGPPWKENHTHYTSILHTLRIHEFYTYYCFHTLANNRIRRKKKKTNERERIPNEKKNNFKKLLAESRDLFEDISRLETHTHDVETIFIVAIVQKFYLSTTTTTTYRLKRKNSSLCYQDSFSLLSCTWRHSSFKKQRSLSPLPLILLLLLHL